MMALKFINNFSVKLLSPITGADTEMELGSGLADLDSVLEEGDMAILTLFKVDDQGEETQREIIHVTAVDAMAETLTIERGKEGTTALDWPGGSSIEQRLTSGFLNLVLRNNRTDPRSLVIGDGSDNGNYECTVIGDGAEAGDKRAIAIGQGAKAMDDDSIVIGPGAETLEYDNVVIGSGAKALGDDSIVIGDGSKTSDDDSMAIGDGAETGVGAHQSFAIGYSSSVGDGSDNSIAIGKWADVEDNTPDAIALGRDASARIKETFSCSALPILSYQDYGDGTRVRCSSQIAVSSEAIDLLSASSSSSLVFPPGSAFFPESYDIVCIEKDGDIDVTPEIQVGSQDPAGDGGTGAPDDYLAPTVFDPAAVKSRDTHTPLVGDGVSTIGVTLNRAATAAASNGVTMFKCVVIARGFLLEM